MITKLANTLLMKMLCTRNTRDNEPTAIGTKRSCSTKSLCGKIALCALVAGVFRVVHDVRIGSSLLSSLPGNELGLSPAMMPVDSSNNRRFLRSLEENTETMLPTYRTSQGIDILQTVRTRFMQRQPHLTELAKGRLALFKAFCFPSMLKQTNQDFAWLVYTDPDLDREVLQELKELLEPHPNYYLVLSNDNELTVPQLVEQASKNSDMVLTGNLDYLARSVRANAASEASVVLYIETGLDADDGLQKDTLSEIQKHAVAETYLWNSSTQRSDSYHWFILCVGNHYEWKNADVLFGGSQDFRGIISEHHNRRRCVTPGLTMVNSLTAPHDPTQPRTSIFSKAPFPYNDLVVDHWHLNEKYPNCRKHGANEFQPCWKQINNNDKTHTAIRARTITSTGLKDVAKATAEELKKSNELWSKLKSDYGILQGQVKKTTKLLYDNSIDIVQDLKKGRCNKGHSCSDQTDRDLKALLKRLHTRRKK